MKANDFDPTTNRIPFCLLTPEEQMTLKKWSHGFEFWWEDKWTSCAPLWEIDTVYRGKPAPVVTSRWFNVLPLGPLSYAHLSLDLADESYGSAYRIAVLRIDTCNGVSTAHLEEI